MKRLERMPPGRVCLFSLASLLGVAAADYISGPELSLSIFYVAPVALAAWCGGRVTGLSLSLAASAAWLSADLASGFVFSHPVVPYWNALARLAVFALIAALSAGLRRRLTEEAVRAGTDPLTGLANSRSFYRMAEAEIDRARRYGHPFSLAYFDLDNFKQVNDSGGHTAGDDLLRQIASVMRGCVRQTDLAARMGGDEFAILFVETGEEDAAAALEKIRSALREALRETPWPVTCSAGLVTFLTPPAGVRQMVRLADDLMYRVKAEGRDGVRRSTWAGEEGML